MRIRKAARFVVQSLFGLAGATFFCPFVDWTEVGFDYIPAAGLVVCLALISWKRTRAIILPE
jgi:hypothetical protein